MRGRRLLAAKVVLAASFVGLLYGESVTTFAQQRAQTDLDFARERARASAAEARVAGLRERLAKLEPRATAPQSARAVAVTPNPAAPRAGERRVPQTLTHRDRAMTEAVAKALRERLDAAEQTARGLGGRGDRENLDARLSALEQELERLDADIAVYE